ncbi:MAG: hypothetical protein LEGION0398_MBIBDBAK_01289 [Legionellaceae bacterium]
MLKQRGYTLLELAFILFLTFLFVFIAIPSWKEWLISIETDKKIRQLISAIHYARTEAIKRNRIIAICPSSDGNHCTSNWNQGYLIFVSEHTQFISEKNKLRFYPAFPSSGTLRWHRKTLFYIRTNGFLGIKNGRFSYCPANADPRFAKEIIISVTGRVRISSELTQACS